MWQPPPWATAAPVLLSLGVFVSRKLDEKQSSWDSKYHSDMGSGHSQQRLSLLHHSNLSGHLHHQATFIHLTFSSPSLCNCVIPSFNPFYSSGH